MKGISDSSVFWRRQALYMVPSLIMVAALFVLLGSEDGVELFFQQHRRAHRGFEVWVEWHADYGNLPYYVIYGSILLTGLRRGRRELVVFFASFLAGLMATLFVTELFKEVIGRPRPPVDGDFEPFVFEDNDDYESFPSGHMTETVFSVSPLAHLFRASRWLPPLLALAPVAMGLVRVYLGRHHPTDLLGGVALGSVMAYAMLRLNHTLLRRLGREDAQPLPLSSAFE